MVQLRLQVSPSLLHVFILSSAYCLILGCLLFLFSHHEYALLCSSFVILVLSLHFYVVLCDALLRSGNSIQQVYKTEAGYRLRLASGEDRFVQWTGDGFVSPKLLIAKFWDGKKFYTLTLLPDSLSGDAHRRARAHFLLYQPVEHVSFS